MKKILNIILIVLVSNLYGQQKPPTSKEIRRSGKYYYYKDYGKDEQIAKEKAKNGLMSLITEKLSKSSEINNVDKVSVQNINYYVKHLTGEVKVVAYVHKDSLQFNKKGELNVVEVVTKEEPTTEIINKFEEKNPAEIEDTQTTETDVEEIKTPERKQVEQSDVVTIKKTIKQNNKNNGDVFSQFLQCDNFIEVDRLMRRLKSQNKINGSLVSRKYRERHNATDFNRIIIDFKTQQIKAVYKKGSNKNLKKPNSANQPDRRDLQFWFKIL